MVLSIFETIIDCYQPFQIYPILALLWNSIVYFAILQFCIVFFPVFLRTCHLPHAGRSHSDGRYRSRRCPRSQESPEEWKLWGNCYGWIVFFWKILSRHITEDCAACTRRMCETHTNLSEIETLFLSRRLKIKKKNKNTFNCDISSLRSSPGSEEEVVEKSGWIWNENWDVEVSRSISRTNF